MKVTPFIIACVEQGHGHKNETDRDRWVKAMGKENMNKCKTNKGKMNKGKINTKTGLREDAMKKWRRWGCWLAAGVMLCLLGGCKTFSDSPEPVRKSGFLLDTYVAVTVYDKKKEHIVDEALNLCRDYEQQLSRTLEGSEIYALNHRKKGVNECEVSASTAELLKKGLDYSQISDGAFDITIEPLSSLWNFTDGESVIPDAEKIREAAKKVDFRQVSVEGNRVIFHSEETTLELGAIAKGYIADQMKAYLTENGVKSGIIDLGGNILCIGGRPDKTPFKIGLQKPFADRSETIAVLNIQDQSVVTSGVYERHFILDGVNYHHILNPKTGYPYDNGLISVTIVSDKSVDGDGLSTTCFSLGLEKGLELVNSLDGVYGYFITSDDQVVYSEGAEELLLRE